VPLSNYSLTLLNEKARDYLAKLDPEISGDYQRLKAALLSELQLSPNLYLERFNACVKNADDVDDSDVRETEYNLPGSDDVDDREGDNDVFVGLGADDNLSMASSCVW